MFSPYFSTYFIKCCICSRKSNKNGLTGANMINLAIKFPLFNSPNVVDSPYFHANNRTEIEH